MTDFTFKVDNDNKVTLVSVETDGEVEVADNGTIVITDSRKEAVTVTVSKQDIAGEEIAGAQIQILDKNGEVIEEWISGSDGENEDGTLNRTERSLKNGPPVLTERTRTENSNLTPSKASSMLVRNTLSMKKQALKDLQQSLISSLRSEKTIR